MERIEIYQEIHSMQISYSFHFVFYLILLLEHILMILKIFWYGKIHLKLFISCSVIDLLFLFYPIFPLIFMYKIILKKNLTKLFKLISLILIILSLVFGVIKNIFFWMNLTSTTNFSRECPYNINDVKLFLNDDFNSELCSRRRCLLESINDSEEGYPFNYICNFNSQNEFEIDPNSQYPIKTEDGSIYYLKYYVKCEQKYSIDDLLSDKNNKNSENEIFIYLQKCWDNKDIKNFYLCQRYELPQSFDIEENYKCPKDNYNIILYLSGIFLIILDIILAFIPWSLDYKSYLRIISLDENEFDNVEINNENNNDEARRRNNETNTTSNNPNLNSREGNNESENNQNENNSNNSNRERIDDNEFIHQPTETIIIARDKVTMSNNSNIRKERLNSGLNSNDISKSIIDNNNNNYKNRKNRKSNEKINSMLSRNESENMINNSTENKNIYGNDINSNKKLMLKINRINSNRNIYNNEDDINFNNNIKYDVNNSNKNEEEDEKDEEDKKSQNNYLAKNNDIVINNNSINIIKIKRKGFKKNKGKIIILTNEDRKNILNESNNSVKTTIEKKDKDIEINKNIENKVNQDIVDDDNEEFCEIGDIINEDFHNKTPNKELKSLKNNFSQVLTNLRETEQIAMFNLNSSIIKEEKKKEIEEEKNKSYIGNKRQNLRTITPLNLKNKDNKKKYKNDSLTSLIVENSDRNDKEIKKKEENRKQNDFINNNEND